MVKHISIFAAAALTAAIFTVPAYAQTSSGMSHGTTKHDKMGHSGMSHGTTKHDHMGHGGSMSHHKS